MNGRGLLARAGVYDRRAVFAQKQFDQARVFRFAAVNTDRLEMQTWPVEIGDDSLDVGQSERCDYVSLDFGSGRRGQREKRGAFEFRRALKHRAVMRAEIMSPLADAMRLVNHHRSEEHTSELQSLT